MKVNYKFKDLIEKNNWSKDLLQLIDKEIEIKDKNIFILNEYECFLIELNNREAYIPISSLVFESKKLNLLIFKKKIKKTEE